MVEVGVAKGKINAFYPQLGMMGWGMLDNFIEREATPLHARAFVVRDGDQVIALVCCELVFISIALRERVGALLYERRKDLGLGPARMLVMATHTHSGPGGFSHYPFYNLTIPGFSPEVLEGLAQSIAAVVERAATAMVKATIDYVEGCFDGDERVAFNRALRSYNRNPDVVPARPDQSHVAVDRTMRMLRFETSDGKPIGSINWFAVHCTSVHSDNRAIHFDNKGYAAKFVEDEFERRGTPGYVAAFAQGASGDVTPNFQRFVGRKFVRGQFVDDDASARFNGRLQAEKAIELIDDRDHFRPVHGPIRGVHRFFDLAAVAVDPRYAGGKPGVTTAPAALGMAMFLGTDEGPGLPRRLLVLQRWLQAARRLKTRGLLDTFAGDDGGGADSQGNKVTWLETTERRAFGLRGLTRIPELPGTSRIAGAVRMVRALGRTGGMPWTPHILPLHVLCLGNIAIVAVPAEFTTVAGRRLVAGAKAILGAAGVEEVVLAGYANGYAGYVATPEEYDEQDYEGASTHFGRWTLPGYQTALRPLLDHLAVNAPLPEPEPQPERISREQLAASGFATAMPRAAASTQHRFA